MWGRRLSLLIEKGGRGWEMRMVGAVVMGRERARNAGEAMIVRVLVRSSVAFMDFRTG